MCSPVAARTVDRQGSPQPAEPGRVLLMDDDPMVREAGRAFLRHLGCETELAADGAEALALYRRAQDAGRPFELVILDLTVSEGMGGREAMAHLLRIDPTVRAVATSGSADSPVMADPAAFGFCGVLFKPWFPADLRRVLQDAARAVAG